MTHTFSRGQIRWLKFCAALTLICALAALARGDWSTSVLIFCLAAWMLLTVQLMRRVNLYYAAGIELARRAFLAERRAS